MSSRHYVTFAATEEGENGRVQLIRNRPDSWDDPEFYELETGGGDPPNHPEDPWKTQYFRTSNLIDTEEAETFILELPAVLDWSFNIGEENG